MADILCQLREEATLDLLENGTGGVGGLETRELGYAELERVLSWRLNGGGHARFPSQELLAEFASAADSGAAGIGYHPSGGLVSTNLQDAMDELAAQLAAGSGGTLVGAMTAGVIPLATDIHTLADSLLSQASGRILFEGDVNVALYRYAANTLGIGGQSFFVDLATFDANIAANKYFTSAIDLVWDDAASSLAAALVRPSLTKNTANVRTFEVLKALATLDAGAANLNTTVNLLAADSVNTSLTGLTVNLLHLAFGGQSMWTVNSDGDLIFSGTSQTLRREDNAGRVFLCGGLTESSSDGSMIVLSGVDDATWSGRMRLYSATDQFIEFFGDTYFSGFEQIQQRAITPANPADDTLLNRYFKGTKYVFQYNDGGTIRYKYLELSGAGAAWADSTIAP